MRPPTFITFCIFLRNIADIEQKRGLAEAEKTKLERLIDLRGKQFYAFLSAAQELRQLLKEEEDDEKERVKKEKRKDSSMEVDQGQPANEAEDGEETGQKAMDTS